MKTKQRPEGENNKGLFSKTALTLFAMALLTVVASPLLLYLLGLSNLSEYPEPAHYVLNAEQEQTLWHETDEVGAPRVRPLNPYTYLASIYCEAQHDFRSPACGTLYPGLRVSAFAIRQQIHEILATYHHHNL